MNVFKEILLFTKQNTKPNKLLFGNITSITLIIQGKTFLKGEISPEDVDNKHLALA